MIYYKMSTGSVVLLATLLAIKLPESYSLYPHITSHYMFRPIWSSSGVKIVVLCKVLCFRYGRTSLLLCGPVYALVYAIVMDRSSCCYGCFLYFLLKFRIWILF
jgi:hypothetical protein